MKSVGIVRMVMSMANLYSISLADFTLNEFRQMLSSVELLPGRRILQEDITARFQALAVQGISNLQDVTEATKNADGMEKLARATGLSEEYLTILRREVNSYVTKPVNLKEIPGISVEWLEMLAAVEIKTSRQLWENATTPAERELLSQKTGLAPDVLLEMVKLADLVRVGGVGPVFARMLYEVGCDTVEKLAAAKAGELVEKIMEMNRVRGYTKVKLAVKDIEYCQNFARRLAKVVE